MTNRHQELCHELRQLADDLDPEHSDTLHEAAKAIEQLDRDYDLITRAKGYNVR